MSAISSQPPPVAPAGNQQPQQDDRPVVGGAVPPVPPVTPAAPPRKFAGKYEGEAAFRTGLNEARKAGGLAPYGEKVKLIGEDGVYATPELAEADYGRYTSLIKPATPASPTNPKPLQIGGELTDEDGPEQILERAGLADKDVAEQFQKNGKLTDEQYAAIRKINPGYGKKIADEIVKGRIAIAQVSAMRLNTVIDEASKPFGGKEAFDKFLRVTAPQFLTTEQQAAYSKMLNDPATTVAAAQTLKTLHAAHLGGGGGNIHSGSPGGEVRQKMSAAEFESLSAQARNPGPNQAAAMARIMQMNPGDITQ